MNTNYKITHTTGKRPEYKEVTIETTEHQPLAWLPANTRQADILLSLLRNAGYDDNHYPSRTYGYDSELGLGYYQHWHQDGDTTDPIPSDDALLQTMNEDKTRLHKDIAFYAPIAETLAGMTNTNELVDLRASIEGNDIAIEDINKRLDDLTTRVDAHKHLITHDANDISELRGNVGELINKQPDVFELITAAHDRMKYIEDGALHDIARNHYRIMGRIWALENALSDVVTKLAAEKSLEHHYISHLDTDDEDPIDPYDAYVDDKALEEAEAQDANLDAQYQAAGTSQDV